MTSTVLWSAYLRTVTCTVLRSALPLANTPRRNTSARNQCAQPVVLDVVLAAHYFAGNIERAVLCA